MPVCILLMLSRSNACLRAGPIRVSPWVWRFFNSFTNVPWLSFHPAYKITSQITSLVWSQTIRQITSLAMSLITRQVLSQPMSQITSQVMKLQNKLWVNQVSNYKSSYETTRQVMSQPRFKLQVKLWNYKTSYESPKIQIASQVRPHLLYLKVYRFFQPKCLLGRDII